MIPSQNTLRLPLFLSALILIGGLLLYTRGNNFSYNYHPDEPVKVKQLISHDWNFHHPLLLLSTADAMRGWLHAGDDSQKVVEAGRLVSALFATLGVLAFMWIGWLKGGPWVAATVTAYLLPHHQVFELAHYLKEDTALFMGIGFTFLALAWAAKVKTIPSIALIGLATGIAFSAKYLGIAGLIVALIWLIFSQENWIVRRRKTLLLVVCAAFVVVVVAVNFQFLMHFASVRSSFDREVDMVVNGQGGVTRSVPNWQYTGIFLDNTNPIIWLGLLGCLIHGWRMRKTLTLEEWLPFIFGCCLAILLSFSPKSNDRYFLPLTGLLCLAAAYGLVKMLREVQGGRWLWLGIAVALASSVPSLIRYDDAFRIDDRSDLRTWLQKQPSFGTIVQEKNIQLPGSGKSDPGGALSQNFLTMSFAPDAGNFEQLHQRGVTHLLVSQSIYGKFFLKSLRPDGKGKDIFKVRQAFYTRLFQEGKLVWKRPRSTVIYLHPGLELYDISSIK